MRALRFAEWLKPARFEDVPQPEPGPGEVLIRIGGAGACHSDLHVMHEWTPQTIPQTAGWSLPFTLGHENAGRMGRIVTIGIGGGGVFPYAFGAVQQGVTLMTTLGGSTSDLAEVVALAEAGRIEPHIEKFALDEALAVYEKLEANEIAGRAVLVP